MVNTNEGCVEGSMAWDTFRMGTGANLDALWNSNPNFMDPIFPSMIMDMPDLSAILDKMDEDNCKSSLGPPQLRGILRLCIRCQWI